MKFEKFDFTVLMAVYHRDDPELFELAVNSVFSNTVKPHDFILVVDGPVGVELARVILALERSFPMRIFWLPKNGGLANALNVGLSYVRTEWVLRADADDYNLPYRFERQLTFMEEGVDLFGSAIVEVDKDGQHLGYRVPPCDWSSIRRFAKLRNPFNHMTVGFRVELARRCGGYPNIHLKEDYGLWASMMMNGAKVANSPDALVEATAGRDMYIRRGGWKYAKAEIELQSHLMHCHIKSLFSACVHGGLRAIVFLAPGRIRGFIYEKVLRYKRG
jgi:glycosyltransferase involved in cell wall biosynthesis